jgi:hypothetical protein
MVTGFFARMRHLILIHGLGEEVIGAGLQALQAMAPVSPTGRRHDVALRPAPWGADATPKLQAIQSGHHPIRDGEPPIRAVDKGPGCGARGSEPGLVTESREGL